MKKLNFEPDIATSNMNQQQQISINPNQLSNFKCPNCNNQVFQTLFVIKRVSPLQSPSGKEGYIPMQIFACTNCGAVPKEFGGTLLEKDVVVDSNE